MPNTDNSETYDDLRLLRTMWRSFMDGIINLLFIGIVLVATWGTWSLALVITCIAFRFSFIGYISPRQYNAQRTDRLKKFEALVHKIRKDSKSNGE